MTKWVRLFFALSFGFADSSTFPIPCSWVRDIYPSRYLSKPIADFDKP